MVLQVNISLNDISTLNTSFILKIILEILIEFPPYSKKSPFTSILDTPNISFHIFIIFICSSLNSSLLKATSKMFLLLISEFISISSLLSDNSKILFTFLYVT